MSLVRTPIVVLPRRKSSASRLLQVKVKDSKADRLQVVQYVDVESATKGKPANEINDVINNLRFRSADLFFR